MCMTATTETELDSQERMMVGAALARMLVGSVVLSVAMLARGQRPPQRGARARPIAAGARWFAAYTFALNVAERWLDAGTSSLLVNTGPLIIALLSGWLLREGFPRALPAGCVVALAGAGLIALSASEHGSHELFGAGLCIAAAFAYALANVIEKIEPPALAVSGALTVTWMACCTGTVVLLGFAPQTVVELGHASAAALAALAYLSVGPTATAFLLWAYVLSRTSAGRLGATTCAVPAIVVLISWITLGQVPTALAILGGVLCLVGVGISRLLTSSPPLRAGIPSGRLMPRLPGLTLQRGRYFRPSLHVL